MRGPGGIVLFAAAAVSVLIGGCSGGDSGAAPPPTVATPTPGSGTGNGASPSGTSGSSPGATDGGTTSSPTSTAAVVAVPRAARAHTFEGADAFARFYFAQVNRAWTTPDPVNLNGLSTTACRTCASYAANAEYLTRKRQRYDRASTTITASGWLPESEKSQAVVELVVTQEPAKVVDASGATVTRDKRVRGVLRCEVAWAHERWQMAKVQRVVRK